MIEETTLKTIKITYLCDDCKGEVKMLVSGEIKNKENYCGPPIKHKCKECGTIYWLDKPYPYIKYKT